MREILFRGKRLDNGEWVYGGIVHQTDGYGKKIDEYRIIDGTDTEDNDIGYSYAVDPATVGQYTGLTDKNGVKIFEGDIVEFVDIGDKYIGKVVFRKEDSGFVVRWNIVSVNMWMIEEVKVIGNIYDNPELLKDRES